MGIIKVCISHPLFSGFSRCIHTIEFNSIQQICAHMKKQLVGYLQMQDLEALIDIAKQLDLVCTNYAYYEQLVSSGVDICYLTHDYTNCKV